jgi:hypothetical protein
MTWKCIIAGAAMAMALMPSMAQADSMTAVENARAKERQGSYLSRQDRELLRRYGGNDDYGPVYSYDPYGYGDDYYAGDDDYEPELELGYRAYRRYPY